MLKKLDHEINKTQNELNDGKRTTIQEIKKFSKQDLFGYKPKKLTLWQRIRKTLMGY